MPSSPPTPDLRPPDAPPWEHSPVGFVGTGNMGLPIAQRLAETGLTVLTFDERLQSRAQAQALGLEVADSLQQVASTCTCVFLCLPSPEVVQCVVEAIARNGRMPKVVDLSTNDPQTARALAAWASERGGTYVDAPVSGGTLRAKEGALTMMLGADEHTAVELMPLLGRIASKVEHIGPAGAGCAAKLLNNFLVFWNMVGASQAFLAAASLGMPLETMHEAARSGSGQSYALDRLFARVRDADYSPSVLVAVAEKDLRLAIGLMQEAGCPPMAASELMELFQQTGRDGSNRDMTAIHQTLQERRNAKQRLENEGDRRWP